MGLRRVFKTFSEKKSKNIKICKFFKNFELFFFSDFFIFFSKKVNFSKTIRYFFLVVSLPLRRGFKTFSDKNSKKMKIFKFVKKFRTTFFSTISSIFEVCSSSDLVNFLEVYSSGVLEEISLSLEKCLVLHVLYQSL